MRLLDFVNDIFDIAAYEDKSWDVGVDMFFANIRNTTMVDAPFYGDPDTTVDYKALAPHYHVLYTEDQLREFSDQVHKFYFDICELRKEGKRDTVDLLFTEKDDAETTPTEE